MYADDILLLSETRRSMNILTSIVSKKGEELQIKFNPSKTICLSINDNVTIRTRKYLNDTPQVVMDGLTLDTSPCLKYLGSYIQNNTKNSSQILARIKSSTIAILKIKDIGFDNNTNPFIIAQLYKTYIRPLLTYGLENLSLFENELDRLDTFECNTIKTALGLPTRIHSKNLLAALGIDSLANRLKPLQTSLFARLLDDDFTMAFIKEIHSTFDHYVVAEEF